MLVTPVVYTLKTYHDPGSRDAQISPHETGYKDDYL